MKNRLLSILTTFLTAVLTSAFATTALAAHHLPFEYAQVYTLQVSDPAALLGAMQKFRSSPTGMKNPSGVSLSQFVANGEDPSTHSIIVSYPSGAAMDAARSMNQGSNDWAEASQTFQSVSEFRSSAVFQLMNAVVKEGAVTSPNPVSMNIMLEVTDQAAFMSAFDKIWNSESAKAFPGNRYLGSALANGQSRATHVVAFQANDMATLLSGMQKMQSSPEMAAYLKKAGSFRRVDGETIGVSVWASPIPAN
jgi:hypothetical protein